MSKPFQPTIVNPSAFYMTDAYGITEARRLELCEKMKALTPSSGTHIQAVHLRFDEMAQFCDTAAEFVFCVHLDTIVIERHQQPGLQFLY